jgi:DNA-directed RNA polymerase subunit RPC12/RpoP
MYYAADNGEDFDAAIAFFTVGWIIVLLFVWSVCAAVAGFIAFERQRSFWLFFATTFFFLGPIGVGFALIAPRGEMDRLPPAAPPPPERKITRGRRRFMCVCCGAKADIPDATTTYECWQCATTLTVKPKATTASEG